MVKIIIMFTSDLVCYQNKRASLKHDKRLLQHNNLLFIACDVYTLYLDEQ